MTQLLQLLCGMGDSSLSPPVASPPKSPFPPESNDLEPVIPCASQCELCQFLYGIVNDIQLQHCALLLYYDTLYTVHGPF